MARSHILPGKWMLSCLTRCVKICYLWLDGANPVTKTVEQISSELNLSVTTVRLVLNGKAEQYRISKKTQARIAEYVDLHGYTINHTARSLKLNKTDTLGLILPRLSNPFFSTLAEKLEIRCRAAGYQLMISCTYGDLKYEKRLVDALLQRNIDGLFVVPSSLLAQKHHIKRVNKPLVLLDRDFGTPDASLVVSDNIQGSSALTAAMLAAGRLPLFFLAGDAQQPTIKERLLGYRRTLAAQDLDLQGDWVLDAQHNRREDGELSMRNLLARYQGVPPAFIASSLPVLEGALSVLREHYGFIPPEIDIGTFDEHAMLGFLPNNIWSVQQNEDAWAERACHAMLQALGEKGATEKAVVPMTLIHRQRASNIR